MAISGMKQVENVKKILLQSYEHITLAGEERRSDWLDAWSASKCNQGALWTTTTELESLS